MTELSENVWFSPRNSFYGEIIYPKEAILHENAILAQNIIRIRAKISRNIDVNQKNKKSPRGIWLNFQKMFGSAPEIHFTVR